jgi:hypothetical protein
MVDVGMIQFFAAVDSLLTYNWHPEREDFITQWHENDGVVTGHVFSSMFWAHNGLRITNGEAPEMFMDVIDPEADDFDADQEFHFCEDCDTICGRPEMLPDIDLESLSKLMTMPSGVCPKCGGVTRPV